MSTGPTARASSSRLELLGAPVDPLRLSALLDRVGAAIRGRTPITIAYVNVHVLDVAEREPDLTAFLHEADIVYCDGNGVRLGARALGRDIPERMTGADLLHDLADRAVAGSWRVGWIGGAHGVVAKAGRVLSERHPGFSLTFAHHGFVTDPEALHRRIAAANLDLLLVGMGTPIQERFVAAHRARWSVPVVWCIGGAADVISGAVPRGPRIVHQRQEWLARLVAEPRRLWRRYLLGNPRFVARIAKAWWSGR